MVTEISTQQSHANFVHPPRWQFGSDRNLRADSSCWQCHCASHSSIPCIIRSYRICHEISGQCSVLRSGWSWQSLPMPQHVWKFSTRQVTIQEAATLQFTSPHTCRTSNCIVKPLNAHSVIQKTPAACSWSERPPCPPVNTPLSRVPHLQPTSLSLLQSQNLRIQSRRLHVRCRNRAGELDLQPQGLGHPEVGWPRCLPRAPGEPRLQVPS